MKSCNSLNVYVFLQEPQQDDDDIDDSGDGYLDPFGLCENYGDDDPSKKSGKQLYFSQIFIN